MALVIRCMHVVMSHLQGTHHAQVNHVNIVTGVFAAGGLVRAIDQEPPTNAELTSDPTVVDVAKEVVTETDVAYGLES